MLKAEMMTENKKPADKKSYFYPASWAVMAVIIITALTFGVVDNKSSQTPGERASSIARTVRCPQCDGETVAESNAPIAVLIRADINTRVSEGETDDEIRSAMAILYGDDIVLLPPATGFGSFVWVVPIVGLSLAMAILGLTFWRWRLAIKADATLDDEKEDPSDGEKSDEGELVSLKSEI